MSALIDHIERHLGPIEKGWSEDPDGRRMPFQIVQTQRGPLEDSVAFATLGLSHWALPSGESDHLIRHELVFVVKNSQVDVTVPSLLHEIGVQAIREQKAILRGDVRGPRGPLFDGSKLEAVYASVPVYFADSFGSCDVPRLGTVVFAWLVPIGRQEAWFVHHCGWERFEDRLVEENPDLIDVFREPMKMAN